MSEDFAKKQRELDEGTTFLSNHMPQLWRALYEKCIGEGFSESDSLQLVRTYILSNCPNGVRGNEK